MVNTQTELNEKINELKKKIMILEWDKEKNQLNPGKASYLNKIKEEVIELQNEIKAQQSKNDKKEIDDNENNIKNNEKEEGENNE